MIDWGAFLIVAVATLVSAVAIVSVYSLGVRLLSVSADVRQAEAPGDGTGAAAGPPSPDLRHRLALWGAVLCFLACAAAVLFGVYLIVPLFH